MQVPATRFTMLGDDRIAYQVAGEGPFDLVFFSGTTSHVDLGWEDPDRARFLQRLASFSRLILFDRRGAGASDTVSGPSASLWELWADDMLAVMDAVGSERAAVFAIVDAGPPAIVFAATHPDRTRALVLGNTTARYLNAPDYPHGLPNEAATAILDGLMKVWGTEEGIELILPSKAGDQAFAQWYARWMRSSAKPRDFAATMDAVLRADVRHALPLIAAPTLVLHRTLFALANVQQAQYIAEHVPGAKLIELPGRDSSFFWESSDEVLDHVEEFLTGARPEVRADRVLATVLFTDIVGSTDRASELGDRRWRQILDKHDELVRRDVDLFRGRVIKTTGDGALATFDGPARAIQCARAIKEQLAGAGIDIRAGLHAGEVELRGEDVGGIAIHIASRVQANASPGEILVSGTVRDLVTGSGLSFQDRGMHVLKGLPDEWRLFALTT